MKIHVIAVAFERYEPLEILILSLLVQTNPDWTLHIVYDGPAPQKIRDIIAPLLSGKQKDSRIHFWQSPERYQNYGHPNRRTMLQIIETDSNDYILMTNDDNYYVPRFVEFMLSVTDEKTGIVYCDTIHSHMGYNIHYSEMRESGIDMGAFIVRADIAKETGFNYDHFSADGRYAEDCLRMCQTKGLKIIKINKPLFIHN